MSTEDGVATQKAPPTQAKNGTRVRSTKLKRKSAPKPGTKPGVKARPKGAAAATKAARRKTVQKTKPVAKAKAKAKTKTVTGKGTVVSRKRKAATPAAPATAPQGTAEAGAPVAKPRVRAKPKQPLRSSHSEPAPPVLATDGDDGEGATAERVESEPAPVPTHAKRQRTKVLIETAGIESVQRMEQTDTERILSLVNAANRVVSQERDPDVRRGAFQDYFMPLTSQTFWEMVCASRWKSIRHEMRDEAGPALYALFVRYAHLFPIQKATGRVHVPDVTVRWKQFAKTFLGHEWFDEWRAIRSDGGGISRQLVLDCLDVWQDRLKDLEETSGATRDQATSQLLSADNLPFRLLLRCCHIFVLKGPDNAFDVIREP